MISKNKFVVIFILCLGYFGCSFGLQANTNNKPLLERKEIKAFIQHMVTKHHFDERQLKRWLGQAKVQPDILKAISKTAETLPWYKYQTIFMSPKRIDEGVNFWIANKESLQRAEQEYGVPAQIIVAIIGVESFYGTAPGKHKVLDSLVTLGFYYPPRAKFFLSELEQFLLLAREEKWDPTQIKGSYAGAMGNPQFISSSYRKFAIDFNNNGKRDLLNSIDDSIGSVANYFKLAGWQRGALVAVPARAKGTEFIELIASKQSPKPSHTLKKLTPLGVKLDASAGYSSERLQNEPFALVKLEGRAGPDYWLGGQNFYVITRYNHSDHYAMAVYTLSEKIKKKYKERV